MEKKAWYFIRDTSIAIKLKVNSKRDVKRYSNSILYFTEVHFDLFCMIKINK